MSERIYAQPPSSGNATEINVLRRAPFRAGGTEEKNHIEGTVMGHPVSLVERDPKMAESYLRNWKAFRAAGLPVVPTLRIDAVRKTVLVTDLKADGSELYGKALTWPSEEDDLTSRRHKAIDHLFLRLMEPTSFAAVKERIHACADLATLHGLMLPEDDPFELLIHPDGRWEIIILDLEYGKRLEGNGSPNANIQEANQECAELLIRHLEFLRNTIK